MAMRMQINRAMQVVTRIGVWGGLAVLLGGCYQSASTPLAPTFAVNVTAPPLVTFTPISLPTLAAPVALATGAVTANVAGATSAAPDQSLTDQAATTLTAVATNAATSAATFDNSAAGQPSLVPSNVPIATDTPFITPIATGGFVTPENGTALLVGTSAIGTAAATVNATANPILSTPTALPSESPCTYTVRPNDHLISIATQVKVSLDALVAANPQLGGNPNALQIGEVLAVPNCGQPTNTPAPPTAIPTATAGTPGIQTYTVQSGDSLYAISQRFNITVAVLEKANNLTDQSILQIGQVLVIPGK